MAAGLGYTGYFLKGLAGGLQSGINMGTQLIQLKWQKQKKKEIDDLNIKISDTWNNIGQEIVSLANDGQLSDDDKLKIYAITMAAPYEMQGVMQNIRSSLSQFRTKEVESQIEYLKTLYDWAQGLPIDDIDAIYESVRPYITDPHALTLFEVADRKLRHEYEVEKAEPIPEVFTSAEALREKYPEAGVRYTDEGYVPTFGEITEPKAPGITDYNSAVNYLSKFKYSPPDIFNKMKTGFQNQFPNIDVSAITQESLREPEKVAEVKPEPTPPVPTTIENIREDIATVDTVEDARRIYKNYVRKYGKEGLDIPEGDVDKFWAERQIPYLNNIKTSIGNIIDEKGWLKKGTLTSAEVGVDFKGEQSVEEIYKMLREEYMRYRDMLEKLGIDISQFPELKPLEEIEKVGLGEGFWGWGKQKGQFKSIYYK